MSKNSINNFIRQKVFVIASFLLMIAMIIAFSLVYTNSSSKANSTRLNLSEKQLLLLNNYMYLDVAGKEGSIKVTLDKLKTNNKFDKNLMIAPASGIKPSSMISMLEEIEKDPILSSLVAVDSIDGDIKATCFVPEGRVNSKQAEACIVYKGTKPLESPWVDNLEGANQADTKLQLEAGDFHERCELKYNITNITGHSKGGNLAQYVTITNGQNVRTCVSFDGQGFSKEFIEKYKDNIAIYAQNIVSISSFKEPVHALLTTVAPTTLYIATDDSINPLNSHISDVLYNESFFDKYGMYNASVLTEETSLAINLNKLSTNAAASMSPETIQSLSENAAPYISYIAPLLLDTVAKEDISTMKALYNEVMERINSDNSLTQEDVNVITQIAASSSVNNTIS